MIRNKINMPKTLVTIGYHYEELEWGKIVREKYISRNLRDDRNIVFYEVKNSNVKTGNRCKKSVEEIKKIIDSRKINLWIDIHCGIGSSSFGFDLIYGYIKRKKKVINKIKKLDSIITNLNRNNSTDSDILHNIGVPCVLIDSFFTEEDYEKRRGGFSKGLEKTLELINQVYDFHLN